MEFNKHILENIPESETMPNGKLKQLLYWENWRKTATFFFLTLMILWDIAAHSVISVVSVAGVLMLSLSICYFGYVWGLRKLRKSNIMDHPYQRYLEIDLSISEEAAASLARLAVINLNPFLMKMSSLFLIEDLLDSLKLLVMLCGLNIVGDYINGMTLLVIGKCTKSSLKFILNGLIGPFFHSFYFDIHAAKALRLEEDFDRYATAELATP